MMLVSDFEWDDKIAKNAMFFLLQAAYLRDPDALDLVKKYRWAG